MREVKETTSQAWTII